MHLGFQAISDLIFTQIFLQDPCGLARQVNEFEKVPTTTACEKYFKLIYPCDKLTEVLLG